jgi:hypothetical protein
LNSNSLLLLFECSVLFFEFPATSTLSTSSIPVLKINRKDKKNKTKVSVESLWKLTFPKET